mmetsp:Transcript_61163/g.85075  ORF Transcript_61163/g.85075 Transcript_61163/m.85075 type:complete len:92 (-) Transcript_61163:27-302(-)
MLHKLLRSDLSKFWSTHSVLNENNSAAAAASNDAFKSLFESMVSVNPEERPTISDIKKSSWYSQEPIYSHDQYSEIMNKKLLKHLQKKKRQ